MISRVLPVLALAVLAACSLRTGSTIPPAAMESDLRAAASTHAPCTLLLTLKSPVSGTPAVANAFGQLMVDSKSTRYAYPAVDFAVPAARRSIFAATAGVATYYAQLAGYGKTIVVRTKSGSQTMYAGLSRVSATLFSKGNRAPVKARQVIATGGTILRFEYAPSGGILVAGKQSNPCGTGGTEASASISVMPASVAVYARFHSLAVNGVALPPGQFPASNPNVNTPSSIGVSNVLVPATVAPTVYERSDVFSDYYVVLCGNAAFATGDPRFARFTYQESQTSVTLASPALPPIVFFRDPGSQAALLTESLPQPWGHACPAPAPVNDYNFNSPIFTQPGQTVYAVYTANGGQTGDTVTFTSSNTGVVTASPSPLGVFPSAPPNWPPPSPHADFTATGVGTATITVTDSSCGCQDPPINVTVAAPPTPAPTPTPMPN